MPCVPCLVLFHVFLLRFLSASLPVPITPFHFGPGLLLKAVAPRRVSFTAFAAANVAIDVESVVNLLAGRMPVHALLHTVPAAFAVGLAAGLGVAGIGRLMRRRPASEVGLRSALLGGALGGLSHPLLDGVMHHDIRPFLPFSAENPLLGTLDLGLLHILCVAAAVLGALGLGWRHERRRQRT